MSTGVRDVKITKSQPNVPTLEHFMGYFRRIRDVATIAKELDMVENLNDNDYEIARKFAEDLWPFVGMYVLDKSQFDDRLGLQSEIEKRTEYHEILKEMQHKDKRLLQIILHSHPDQIDSHPKLQKIVIQRPKELLMNASIDTTQRKTNQLTASIDRAGLSLGKEIKEMHELFMACNQAVVDLNSVVARSSEISNRNKMYIVGSADKKVIMKLIEDLEHYEYEIAASEMSELAGFTEVTLPTKRGSSSGAFFLQNGDVVQKNYGVNLNKNTLEAPNSKKHQRKLSDPGKVLMQTFAPSKSGVDYYLAIAKKMSGDKQTVPSIDFLGVTPSLRSTYIEVVKPLLEMDQWFYELNILNTFILGDNDNNPGNTLFSDEDDRIFSIDHEAMMPENNVSTDVDLPVVIKLEIDLKAMKLKPVTTKVTKLREVCPIHNWMIGLPQANVPFSKKTIQHVLSHLNKKAFEQYHKSKNLFSEGQVNAQLERIDLVLKLFDEQSKKAVADLTPRKLYLEVVGKHPTYDLLKNKYQLADYFVFQLLGKVPSNVSEDATSQLKVAMGRYQQKIVERQQLKAVVTKKIVIGLKEKHVNSEHFGAANIFSQIQEVQKQQVWFDSDPDLYYLIRGEKKLKAEEKL